MKMQGKCFEPKLLKIFWENGEDDNGGGHDLVRRVDRQGEVLKWRRKCSGFARQRMGPKRMNRCKPEPDYTQGYGNMLKRIQVLEDGRVPAKEARNGRIEGQKRRITRKRVSAASEQV